MHRDVVEDRRGPVGKALDRREFLKLGGAGLAGLALLGSAAPVLGETVTSAPTLGISKSNPPSQNRTNLVRALTDSRRHVVFPPGDYFIDNSGSYIVIRNFGGTITMKPGARFVFTDNTRRGLMFERGSGARLHGVRCAFRDPPTRRFSSEGTIVFIQATEPAVRNVRVFGSAGVGLHFGRCIRPFVGGAVIKNTQADGLHFANCRDARANEIFTENTGDDGLAFLNYANSSDYAGGLATNITVRRSRARGIAVVGQRNVVIRNFEVVDTDGNGLYCAREVSYNTRVPSNVRFAEGIVRDAGRPGGPGGTNYGIFFHHVGSSILFRDIRVVAPAARGISGMATNGVARLNNLVVYRSREAGFHFTEGRFLLANLTTRNSRGTGFYIADNRRVDYKLLRSINSSRGDDLRRAFSFERNARVEGEQLIVLDNQRSATGYVVNSSGKQAGRLGKIYDRVASVRVRLQNPSRLSYSGPVRG
jgi:hypothetical protein